MADAIEVKSSRIPNDPLSNAEMDPEYKRQIHNSMLASGASKRVEEAIEAELRKRGWVNDLREYMRMLLRTGEAKSANEVMVCVHRALQMDSFMQMKENEKDSEGVNGHSAENVSVHSGADPVQKKMLDDMAAKVKVPDTAVAAGVGVIQKEMDKCVDITIDDFGGST